MFCNWTDILLLTIIPTKWVNSTSVTLSCLCKIVILAACLFSDRQTHQVLISRSKPAVQFWWSSHIWGHLAYWCQPAPGIGHFFAGRTFSWTDLCCLVAQRVMLPKSLAWCRLLGDTARRRTHSPDCPKTRAGCFLASGLMERIRHCETCRTLQCIWSVRLF